MTGRPWNIAQTANELLEAAKAATQLSIRISGIFLRATPDTRLRLDKLDSGGLLNIDGALEVFIETADRISEQLLDELEYPNGGSHREPGYRHFDGAS